ncbi:hypothetical protein V6N12_049531 [Hibiscus sabdariffa]|uniref:Uncharacterized protein n=1 Tax=Hibiscus sabdariffa TaxID=183260 RepID=A0ABR2CBL5_9ROSI
MSCKLKLFAPLGSVKNELFDWDSRAASRNSLHNQEVLKIFTSFKPKLFSPPGNVENVGKDSRATSRNSLLHQEVLKMLVRIHELQAETLHAT